MMTPQNLDVHGTFGVHRSKFIIPFIINALTNKKPGFIALVSVDSSDQSDRYHFDLYKNSRPEYAQAPMAGGLSISEGSSTAYQQEEMQ